VIFGLTGNDVLKGGTGNDVLCGGPGADGLNGESGNDQLYGQNDRDLVVAAGDNDTAYGGNGLDGVYGGPGADTLSGGTNPADDPTASGDDMVADYVGGGADADIITPGTDDETYDDSEPTNQTCPVVTHATDPEFFLAKLGTFQPDRLDVKNPRATDPSKHCRGFTGTVRNYHPAGDGDAKWEMPRNKVDDTSSNPTATIVLTATEILNDPDPFLLVAEAKKKVRVEVMPRDWPHFPHDIAANRKITVWGLWISDESTKTPQSSMWNCTLAIRSRTRGRPTTAARGNAGSPVEMRPKGGKLLTDADKNSYRYCWYPNGSPCEDWNEKTTDTFR
jgi:hypothetical protein